MVRDYILEVGIVSEHGACFSTVVRPPVVPSEAECDNNVHGIPAAELRAGPEFKIAYSRMISFLEHLQVSSARLDDSDSEAEPCVTTSYDDPLVPASLDRVCQAPVLVSRAHGGRWTSESPQGAG